MRNTFSQKGLSANRGRISKLISSVKVIYTDVDGTLVGPRGCFFLDAGSGFTLRPAEMLVLAHKNNVDVVMTSGRNRMQLLGDARLLGTKNYIAELGCQIVYELGEKIVVPAGEMLNESPHKTIFEIIAQSGAVELLFETFPGCLEYHKPWSEWRECTHLFRGFIDIDLANETLRENDYEYLEVIDNGVISRRGTLQGLSEIHAYHLLPSQSNKAEAVKRDREIRNIPRESAIAIGDASSDLVLANRVGAFFLVKNALGGSSSIAQDIEQFDNVFITNEEMGLGFAEVVEFVLNVT